MDHQEVYSPPDFRWPVIRHYFATRLSSLKPPPWSESKKTINPIPALRLIDRRTWLFIGVAFMGWTWDAVDFFSVSLTTSQLSETFDVGVKKISWGITLVLMFRVLGAAIFGLAADKWGRKWPFIVNLLMFVGLELGTGFTTTYAQFLGIRAVFGIAMGGIYGNCAATALEDCPVEARGFVSGFLQQGYAFGYLLVVVFNRALVDTTKYGWRPLYWFCGSFTIVIIIWRLLMGETNHYKMIQSERGNLGKSFLHQCRQGVKTHWHMFIYMFVFMSVVSFMSHGSQDLFPTRFTKQFDYNKDQSTICNAVANIGAFVGGVFFGHFSQVTGRRLGLLTCFVIGGALIYPWGFSKSFGGICASVFFFQACVQGVLGIVPIYLTELSPASLRAFVVGFSYQLGTLAASATPTIEAELGDRFPLPNPEHKADYYDYGKVMAIVMGCVFGVIFIVTLLGPERRDKPEDDTFQFEDVEKLSIRHTASVEEHKEVV